MQIAYFDAFSGISGDMTVGALLHLGVSLDALRAELAKLPLTGYRLDQTERQPSGIRATKFHVEISEPLEERSFHAIAQMLQESLLTQPVKEVALQIFTVLAAAEGRVHGIPTEAVHFHEVGAVDSIVDIVGTAFGLYTLGIEKVYVSSLPMGRGLVPSRHGVLPIPAPATVELLKGLQVRLEDGGAELVTPTGAAIVAAVAQQGAIPPIQLTAVGYGAGERSLPDRPNLLRILVGRTEVSSQTGRLVQSAPTSTNVNPGVRELEGKTKQEHSHSHLGHLPPHHHETE